MFRKYIYIYLCAIGTHEVLGLEMPGTQVSTKSKVSISHLINLSFTIYDLLTPLICKD